MPTILSINLTMWLFQNKAISKTISYSRQVNKLFSKWTHHHCLFTPPSKTLSFINFVSIFRSNTLDSRVYGLIGRNMSQLCLDYMTYLVSLKWVINKIFTIIFSYVFEMDKPGSMGLIKEKRTNRLKTCESLSRPLKEEDSLTAPKRRVSLGTPLNKTIKQKDTYSPRRASTGLAPKLNFKLSTDVISFEMDEQRNHQMKIIEGDLQLKQYYIAFKKVFLLLFQCSYFLMENMFRLSLEMYTNKQLKGWCLLFELPKEQWNMAFLQKAMIIARNVIFMASSPAEFERRIDMVARKVTLQTEKKQRIRAAFLNPKVQKIWEQSVEPFFPDHETADFVEDQFDTPEEKMCFLEVKEFVVKRLCTEAFGAELRRFGLLEQIDDDINLDFKFEFILTEEFSFNYPEFLKKEEKKPEAPKKEEKQQKGNCMIM